MDFFNSQESLTLVQWALRAIVGFFFLMLLAKIMGQRAISQLRFLDYVMALLIGNIIAHPLSDESLELRGSMITMSVLVILYVSFVLLSLKWNTLRKLFDPSPLTLIENGKINHVNLKKARINVDFLLTELRKEKTEDIKKVALALWEPGGTISIFLESQHQPLTPIDMTVMKEPFDFPKTIIKERKIDLSELQRLGKDEQWVINKINTLYNVHISDILLATIDKNDNINIFLY